MVYIRVENSNTFADKVIDCEILDKKSNVQLKIWRMFKNVNEKKFKRANATKIQRQRAYD